MNLKETNLQELNKLRSLETQDFAGKLALPHMQVSPCFMTGRSCVYSEKIEENRNPQKGKKKIEGFVIMPFRPNLSLYHNNCLNPFIRNNYLITENGETESKITIETANQVRRPGVIICEGICKRIQESDFILADLSLPNSNVFYELGLAYGLNQKIIVIYKNTIDKNYKPELENFLNNLGCDVNKRFSYSDLSPLTLNKSLEKGEPIKLSDKVWQREESGNAIKPVTDWQKSPSETEPNLIIFYSSDMDYLKNKPREKEKEDDKTVLKLYCERKDEQINSMSDDDIVFEFEEHVPSAIGISIAEIHSALREKDIYKEVEDKIELLKTTKVIKSSDTIDTVKKWIDKCYCFAVRTGGEKCNPQAYFWLGYCHAIGKNVIPITCVDKVKSRVDDLAFDIRAHRHITFVKENPELFTQEIKETLRLMIESDFKDLFRKRFWNGLIGKGGEISIFTGALHSEENNREMIGDWDLLSVSELTSYFGRNQFRFKIEAPIYPPETAYIGKANELELKEKYILKLKEKLKDKNCILIASPDVNPLTEIIFGEIFGFGDRYEDYFNDHKRLIEKHIQKSAWLSYKLSEQGKEKKLKRTFFIEETIVLKKGDNLKAGFKLSTNLGKNDFVSDKPTVEPNKNNKNPHVFGHLLIARNPITSGQEKKYVIVLNGVGGPATFALTHVLTGGVITEFTVYGNLKEEETLNARKKEPKLPPFNPDTKSESILEKFSRIFDIPDFNFIDALLKVSISDLQDNEDQKEKVEFRISDWRRISGWELQKSIESGETRIDRI
jgi:hypothetical protein